MAWKHDVQVMIEGPGHVPMHQIKENVEQQQRAVPRGALLHARPARHRHRPRLRPHHLGHRRGDDRLVRHRDALLRDAQGAPGPARTSDDVKQGVIAYKIAAHAADLAKGHPRRPGGTTPCPRPASSSAGRTSSTWPSTPRPPALTTTRRCPPSRPRPPTSARCAVGRSSAGWGWRGGGAGAGGGGGPVASGGGGSCRPPGPPRRRRGRRPRGAGGAPGGAPTAASAGCTCWSTRSSWPRPRWRPTPPTLQIRLKAGTDGDRYRLAHAIAERCRAAGATCLVNDRADLAVAIDADGVHVGADDLPVPAVRRVVGPERWWAGPPATPRWPPAGGRGRQLPGRRAHLRHHLQDRPARPHRRRGRAAVVEAVDVPVLAIAGITAARVDEVMATGATAWPSSAPWSTRPTPTPPPTTSCWP